MRIVHVLLAGDGPLSYDLAERLVLEQDCAVPEMHCGRGKKGGASVAFSPCAHRSMRNLPINHLIRAFLTIFPKRPALPHLRLRWSLAFATLCNNLMSAFV